MNDMAYKNITNSQNEAIDNLLAANGLKDKDINMLVYTVADLDYRLSVALATIDKLEADVTSLRYTIGRLEEKTGNYSDPFEGSMVFAHWND